MVGRCISIECPYTISDTDTFIYICDKLFGDKLIMVDGKSGDNF